jgi:hypothetical protein
VKFYKYWAKGEATVPDAHPWKVRAFGSSDISIEEAQQRGKERAERVAAAVVNGRAPGAYEYDERPLREEVVEEIRDGGGVVAAITRNSYGSLVLNTSRVMFADVDIFPPAPVSFGEALRNIWRSLRGKSAADRRMREETLVAGFDEVCGLRPGLGFRIYRTCAGFRLLVTSSSFDPSAAGTLTLLKAFRFIFECARRRSAFGRGCRLSIGDAACGGHRRDFPGRMRQRSKSIVFGRTITIAWPISLPCAN